MNLEKLDQNKWETKMNEIKLQSGKLQKDIVNSFTIDLIYEPISPQSKQYISKMLTTNVKSVRKNVNSNLSAFSLTLLKIIYNDQKNDSFLQILMKHLNLPSNNFTQISHRPNNKITNLQAKMSLTLLLKSNQSCNFETIQQNLSDKPQLLELMVIFLRVLLKNCNLDNAQDYQKSVNTGDSYSLISDIFRIECRDINNIYLFQQNGLFIVTPDEKEYSFGRYFRNETEMLKEQEKLTSSAIQQLYNKCGKSQKKIFLDESRESSNSQDLMFKRDYNGQPTPTFNVTPTFHVNTSFPKQENILVHNPSFTEQSESNIYNVVQRREKVFGIISMIESVDEGLSKNQFSSICDSPVQFQLANIDKQIMPISPTTWKAVSQKKNLLGEQNQPKSYASKRFQQEKGNLQENSHKSKSQNKSKQNQKSVSKEKSLSKQKSVNNSTNIRIRLYEPPSPSNSLKAQKKRYIENSTINNSISFKSNHKRFLTKSYVNQCEKQTKQQCHCVKVKQQKIKLCSNLYRIEIRQKPMPNLGFLQTAQSPKASKNFFSSIKFQETQKYSPKINQENEQQKKKRNQDQFYNIFRKKIQEDKFKSQSERFLTHMDGQKQTMDPMKGSPNSCLNKSKNQSIFNFNEEPYQINKSLKFFKGQKNSRMNLSRGKDNKNRCHTETAKSPKERKSSLNYTIKKRVPQSLFKSEKDDIKMALQVPPVNCYFK